MTAVPEGFPRLDKQTRPWLCKWDNAACLRTKPCPRCLGARNRRKGLKKQRVVARELKDLSGAPVGRYASQTGNEENWRGPMLVEAKAGAQVKAIATKYVAARGQANASRAVGDGRPFAMAAIPDGWPNGEFLWVIASADLPAIVEALTA